MSAVVVAYVPGPFGEAALAAGIERAQADGLRLVVVNTTPGDRLVDSRYAQPEQVATIEERLAGAGVEHEVRSLVGGRTPEAIVDVVNEVGAELLVIGLRRRSPVGKLLLGSMAVQLLMESPVPVLAVKPAE